MSDAATIMKMLKENEINYVDLRFTDPRGKMQHVTQHIETIDEDSLAEGFMFDGSSIAGWKAINESDMNLMPDLSRVYVDPFFAQPTLAIFCDVLEPSTGENYSRDPRSTAKAALSQMESLGIADTAFFGPEAEFFLFDDVKYDASMNRGYYEVDSVEGPYNTARDFEEGNLGHRPGVKGGYFPVPPVDSGQDIRSEMLSVMAEMGVPVEKHHHEVAPSQHELGMKFGTLLETADNLQLSSMLFTMWPRLTVYRRPSCQSRLPVITAPGCMFTSRSGWMASLSLPVTVMLTCLKPPCITSAVSSSTPRPSMLSPTRRPTLISV